MSHTWRYQIPVDHSEMSVTKGRLAHVSPVMGVVNILHVHTLITSL